jgi:hypothetical protein
MIRESNFLSYSSSRGLFAGVNLTGAVIRPDDLDRAVYNRPVRKLLGNDGQDSSDEAAGLRSFPHAVGQYTTGPGTDQKQPEN